MPMTAHSFSIGPYKDSHQKELLKILDSHQGPKAIYWERDVIAAVNLIVGNSVLKVRRLRIFSWIQGIHWVYIQIICNKPRINSVEIFTRSRNKIIKLVR